MAKELSAIALEKIKPGLKRVEIPDGRIGGLYFIIQPNGKRSWAFRYRFGGKPCKFTIGQYPATGLAAARAKGAELKNLVEAGTDPGAEKKASRASAAAPANDLVETVVARFLAQYAPHNLKASTISEVTRILNREIVPAWRGRRLSQISRADIHSLLDGIVERGAPVTANRTRSWFRKLCNWAIEKDLIESNACTGVKRPAKETARDRVLSDEELKTVWQISQELEQPYREFVQVLVLTGQRVNEVAGMRWGEIDLAKATWILPKERTKNKREHEVPLAPSAVDILASLPRIAGSAGFVFTISGRQAITGQTLIKRRIDASMPGATHWVFHDIRRTVASGLARLGVNLPVIEKLLNHVSGSFAGIVGVYQRHSFADEKRAAMATWARFVESLVTGETGNVVPMAARDGR